MKKYRRITKSYEFDKIIKNRQVVKYKSFSLYFYPKNEKYPRYGIAVPKRIGNAVTRNKVKRQVREMIRSMDDLSYPFDIIIIVRPSFLKETYDNNRKDLEKIMKTVKMKKSMSS